MPKAGLRRTLLLCRSRLSPLIWQTTSRLAQKRLMTLDVFSEAATIALYAPIRNEVDTALIFGEARRVGKGCFIQESAMKRCCFMRLKMLVS